MAAKALKIKWAVAEFFGWHLSRHCAVLGKALAPLATGVGVLPVLIALQ
jgi:hypothetical protein